MPKSISKKVRYAVVGLGHFGQAAVLPAFKNAKENSELVAFVSSDPLKHRKLGQRYGVKLHYSYDQYGECVTSGLIDAVYIVLPNTLHREYTVRAAQAGIHVLCEKPLATSSADCEAMVEAATRGRAKLMTAYRLHFEEANLSVIDLVTKGKIGEPKFFSSVFSHQVRPGNIRARNDVGGGGLWDLGVYCVNAARYLFRAEPYEAYAVTANTDPKRFHGVDEIASVILKLPDDRVAQFTTSQGAADTSQYRIVGTKGDISVEPAYEYAGSLAYKLTVNGKSRSKEFPKRDQISAEILYFSDCILSNKQPEPSAREGWADVRVIEALYESAKTGRPIRIAALPRSNRPDVSQTIKRPGVEEPELVNASPASE